MLTYAYLLFMCSLSPEKEASARVCSAYVLFRCVRDSHAKIAKATAIDVISETEPVRGKRACAGCEGVSRQLQCASAVRVRGGK